MSATEIIQPVKTMPVQERRTVFQLLTEDLRSETAIDDTFTVLGKNPDATDVTGTVAARSEVVRDERA